MRFENLDLNLLVALDVLLEELNITRAAERLNVTQSAASGVLGRLRTYFDDDLLVQVGRTMQPTPFALTLQQPVREVLLTIRSSIIHRPEFDPATSKRHFRVVTSDYLVTVLLAQVLQNVYQTAPHITFEVIGPNEASDEMLGRGEVDLMIAPERYLVKGHPSQLVFEEQHVCVVCQRNALVGKTLQLEQYLELGHVSVSFGRSRVPSVEEWLMNQFGVSRRLEVITNNFNTLPQLVVGTNRIATMHTRLAYICIKRQPLRILPPPVELPPMREFMIWHRALDNDPMHRWLREQIVATAAKFDAQSATLS